ncbi:hypothetical protein R3Q06_33420 [Rhodococcus erythropolis]|uniref:hypothetical protein n=1 Tax=Rhodococcus erythropolis TaxID=1833 RepID=UPI00294A5812|nr:hypothetical protein [Rhodococcus erythropolis]MDV6278341.1 hypothetical protein [Rhodococcus erythropolis]
MSIARTYGLDQPTVSQLVRPHAPPERSRRRAHGTTNGAGKLTDDQVRYIRSSFDTGGITQVSLARQYDISPSVVHGIVMGKTYSHLREDHPNGSISQRAFRPVSISQFPIPAKDRRT